MLAGAGIGVGELEGSQKEQERVQIDVHSIVTRERCDRNYSHAFPISGNRKKHTPSGP